MKSKSNLVVSLLLLVFGTTCWSQSIIIEVDGSVTVDQQFCAGMNITLVCTIPGNAFVWRSSLFSDLAILTVDGTRAIDEYYLTATTGRSTLSFITVMELNNVVITCTDGGNNPPTISLEVLGTSYPVLSAVGSRDFLSVTIRVDNPSRCAQRYDISIIFSNNRSEAASGSVLNVTDGNIIDMHNILMGTNLSLCFERYYVEVNVTFIDGSKRSGQVPVILTTEVIGNLEIHSSTNGAVSWMPVFNIPDIPDGCISDYVLTGIIQRTITDTNIQLNLAEIGDCSNDRLEVTARILEERISSISHATYVCIAPTKINTPVATASQKTAAETVGQSSPVQLSVIIGPVVGGVSLILTVVISMFVAVLLCKPIQQKFSKDKMKEDQSASERAADIGMVDCIAYGTVSVKLNTPGAGYTPSSEDAAAGVYETI